MQEKFLNSSHHGVFIFASLLAFNLSACSSFQRHGNETATETAAVTSESPATNSADTHASVSTKSPAKAPAQAAEDDGPQIKLLDKNGKVVTSKTPSRVGGKEVTPVEVPATQASGKPIVTDEAAPTLAAGDSPGFVASRRKAGPVDADKALGWLKNGNRRFVKNLFRKDGASSKDRRRLIASETPHAVVIADSDSRVAPEILFDQKLGEIYVVRVAGLSMTEAAIGSVEYAVEYLGANLIVVMGQDYSAAVKAAFGTLDGGGLGSPNLNAMIAGIRPHLQEFRGQAPSKGLVNEAWANVTGVSHDLPDRSQIIRDALTSGSVKVAPALYHLETGDIEWRSLEK